jgi:alpha-tubulin suppressor-like RCC1 family protein
MKDNSVECWGLNANGQLGSGVNDAGTFDPTSQSIPRVVQGLGPAAFVTAGWHHTCALLLDNSVWCWGDNSKAQLGMTASTTPQPVPQKITLTGTVAEVEAGGWHTCVRMQTGAVQCWGFNTDGQVGTGSGNPNSPATVPAANTVAGFGSATDLGLGSRYSCALIGGGAQCIGNNFFGELGRGTPISLPFTPTAGAVGGLAGATDIARANGEHQCAVIDGGTLQCWGRNDNGQLLVDSGAATYIVAPNAIPGVSTAVEVAPGGTHTCAALANGEVWCWGGDLHGQTGQASNDAGTAAATKVAGITTAIHIASGWADFSCASLKGGSVKCWGANYDSELGRGTGGVLLPFDEKPALIKFQ